MKKMASHKFNWTISLSLDFGIFKRDIFDFSKEKTSSVDDDNNDDNDIDDDIDDCDFNQMRAKRMFHVSQFFSVVSKRRICQSHLT